MTEQEYNLIEISVAKLKKKETELKNELSQRSQSYITTKKHFEDNKFKVFGLNPKFYLWVFTILFIYTFFIRDFDFSNILKFDSDRNRTNNSINSPIAKNYILFEKPDNTSNIILKNDATIEVTILNETKFYYNVELFKNGKRYVGFINKKNIKK